MSAATVRRPGINGEHVLLAVVTVYVLIFAALPLARILVEAFLPDGRIGLDLVWRVLSSRAASAALVNTIEAGIASTLLSLVLGTLGALAVGLSDVRLKPALVFLFLMPLLVPAQIAALSWLELLGPSSPVLAPLGLAPPPGTRNPLYSREGVIFLMGLEHSALVFLSVRAGLRTVPRNLVEAARSAGAGPLRIVVDVVLPLVRPAMVGGAALAFVSSIGNFGIPALLGIPGRYTLLTTLIYQRLSGFGPRVLGEVGTLALMLAVLAGAGLVVQTLALRHHRSPSAGTMDTVPFPLGRRRVVVEGMVWGFLLLTAVLPLAALAGTSLVTALGVPLSPGTATLEHYRYVLAEYPATRRAFANSTALAGLAAIAVAVVSVPLGHIIVRRPRPLIRLLDGLADAPFALPGIVLSIACIMIYLKPLPVAGVGLYGTFWIILFAYLGRFLALGLRSTIAGLRQIDVALEEAAQASGAGALRRLVTVVRPLASPAAMAGAVLVFMSAFNELTVSILLWSSGHETLGVMVFNLYDEGHTTAAAAVSVLSVLATLAMAALVTLAARWLPRGVLPWQA
ncbi:ABC transporter permease [Shumkonia mesophila]|uniref:ABC transporter permease n=1 Tax=Shumkonia mesophila TaxID=2838854 RepID=UPI0029348DDD|nr:iron ABC transporter permease [Shumkonia mesophila]